VGNVDEIIDRIKGRSRRDVERMIAEYEPKAAVPGDRVRWMIVPVARAASSYVSAPKVCAPNAVAATPASMAPERPVVTVPPTSVPVAVSCSAVATPTPSQAAASNCTVTGDSEKSPNAYAADNSSAPVATNLIVDAVEIKAPAAQPVQFERLVRVEFTTNEKLMTKLERVRSLASHRLPANATLEELIDFMAEYVIRREDPIKRQERRESRGAKHDNNETRAASTNPRQIPAKVRDEVFVRDNQCAYVSPQGQRCGSTHVLQIDHIKPVARGGASTIDNLRVLCAYHNRLESERLMGKRSLRTQ